MSSKQLSAEERKARAMRIVEEGRMERDARMGPPITPTVQIPPPPPAPVELPPPPAAPAPSPAPPRIRPSDDEENRPAPDSPESFGGIVESRKGLKARGWKAKNTLFHPREIAMGEAAAREWGMEWSELCNLALALIIDPSQRTEATSKMLADIQRRRT